MVHAINIAWFIYLARQSPSLTFDLNYYCCFNQTNATGCNNHSVVRNWYAPITPARLFTGKNITQAWTDLGTNTALALITTFDYPGFCTENSTQFNISTWFGYHFVATIFLLVAFSLYSKCNSSKPNQSQEKEDGKAYQSRAKKVLYDFLKAFQIPKENRAYQSNDFKNIIRVVLMLGVLNMMINAYHSTSTDDKDLVPFKSGLTAMTEELKSMTRESPAWWDTFTSFSIPLWLKGTEILLQFNFATATTKNVRLPAITAFSVWAVLLGNVSLTYIDFLTHKSKTNPGWDILRGFAYIEVGSMMLCTLSLLANFINSKSCKNQSASQIFEDIIYTYSPLCLKQDESLSLWAGGKDIANQFKVILMTILNAGLFTGAHFLAYTLFSPMMVIPACKTSIERRFKAWEIRPFSISPYLFKNTPIVGYDLNAFTENELHTHGVLQKRLNKDQKALVNSNSENNRSTSDSSVIDMIFELNPVTKAFIDEYNNEQKSQKPVNTMINIEDEETGNVALLPEGQTNNPDNDNIISCIFGNENAELIRNHYTLLIQSYEKIKTQRNNALSVTSSNDNEKESCCIRLFSCFNKKDDPNIYSVLQEDITDSPNHNSTL